MTPMIPRCMYGPTGPPAMEATPRCLERAHRQVLTFIGKTIQETNWQNQSPSIPDTRPATPTTTTRFPRLPL